MAVGVGISLPPHVPGSIQGQLHAELLGFQGPAPPFMGALEWWGQDSAGTLLQLGGASGTRSEVAGFAAAAHARVAFPIRSAPKHFMAYLQDMQVLRVHLYQGGSKDKQQGICEIDLRPFLRGSDSDYKLQLDGYFPVLRSSSDRIIIGQLRLLLQTEWGELAELRPKQARDEELCIMIILGMLLVLPDQHHFEHFITSNVVHVSDLFPTLYILSMYLLDPS